jgi:hypothetical protein
MVTWACASANSPLKRLQPHKRPPDTTPSVFLRRFRCSFQGQEAELVLVSTVRAQPRLSEFMLDYRRTNVSLSRCMQAMVVVGHHGALSSVPPIPAARAARSAALSRGNLLTAVARRCAEDGAVYRLQRGAAVAQASSAQLGGGTGVGASVGTGGGPGGGGAGVRTPLQPTLPLPPQSRPLPAGAGAASAVRSPPPVTATAPAAAAAADAAGVADPVAAAYGVPAGLPAVAARLLSTTQWRSLSTISSFFKYVFAGQLPNKTVQVLSKLPFVETDGAGSYRLRSAVDISLPPMTAAGVNLAVLYPPRGSDGPAPADAFIWEAHCSAVRELLAHAPAAAAASVADTAADGWMAAGLLIYLLRALGWQEALAAAHVDMRGEAHLRKLLFVEMRPVPGEQSWVRLISDPTAVSAVAPPTTASHGGGSGSGSGGGGGGSVHQPSSRPQPPQSAPQPLPSQLTSAIYTALASPTTVGRRTGNWFQGGAIGIELSARGLLHLVPDSGAKGALAAVLQSLPRVEFYKDERHNAWYRLRGGSSTQLMESQPPRQSQPTLPQQPQASRPAGPGVPATLAEAVRAIFADPAFSKRSVDAGGWAKSATLGSALHQRGTASLVPRLGEKGALEAAVTGIPGVETRYDRAANVRYFRLARPAAAPAAAAPAVVPAAVALPAGAPEVGRRAVREALFAARGDHVYGPSLQAAVAAALIAAGLPSEAFTAGGVERLLDLLLTMPDVVAERSGELVRARFR